MGDVLQNRIKQTKFASIYQQAHLSMMVAADTMQREFDELCESYNITAAQYNVLRILRGVHPDGHARCDIIERMIQQAPDVTRLIDRLVKAGLAKRGKSKDDGRLSLTFITKKGLNLLDKMEPHVVATDKTLQKRISKSEAQSLLSICEKLFAD